MRSPLGASLALAVVLAAAAAATAGDALRSGPQVGEKCGLFDVKDVTGPHKGKQLCYV